jgi:hypothetical protein
VVGSGVVHHVTRDSRAGTVSSYCCKRYPCFRVPTMFMLRASELARTMVDGVMYSKWL